MSNHLSLRTILPAAFVLLCWTSCIDDGYDLSDLDTDEITLGDKWSVKLALGSLSAADILDVDNVEEIFTDGNGDFIARYNNVLSVLPDNPPTIKDQSFPLAPVDLPGFTAVPSGGFEVVIPTVSRIMEVKASDEVERLDYALFNTGWDTSLLTVVMRTSDFYAPGSTATIRISLPEGYLINDAYIAGDAVVDGTDVTWTVELGSVPEYRISLPVAVIDVRGDNTVSLEGIITVPDGTSPTVGTDPQVTFSIRFENLDYQVIYGKFDILFDSTPKTAEIGNLYDIFDGDDAVMSFREPYLLIRSESNIGMPVNATLEIYPDQNPSGDVIRVEDIVMPAAPSFGSTASARFWIGDTPPVTGDYIFKYAQGLGNVIKDSRELIYLAGSGRSVDSEERLFYPKDAVADLDYTVEIPLAPAKDFYAVSKQVVEDAFGELIDYIFSGGTAEILGTATNSIPLSFDLEMIITDYAGESVGITFPVQKIAGPSSRTEPSVSEISFYFDESAMARMANAQDMVLRFAAHGTDDAPALNVADELILDLKLRKSGGITINNDDDDDNGYDY